MSKSISSGDKCRKQLDMFGQDVKYDVTPEEEFAGESAQWDNLKAKRYGAGRRVAKQYNDDADVEYANDYSFYVDDGYDDEVGNGFRRRRGRGRGDGRTNVVSELLSQMQHTAALLERFVIAATANRRSTPVRRRPTPKNADEYGHGPATSTAEKTARDLADHLRRRPTADAEPRAVGGSRRRSEKISRRRGDLDHDRDRRLLHVTLLGRLERLPAEAPNPVIGAAQQSRARTSQKSTNDGNKAQLEQEAHLKHQPPEVHTRRTTPTDDEDDNDDDIEIVSDRIRSIIADPDSSFTYDNISSDDMVSLEEMMSQSSRIGTMQLVDENDERAVAIKKEEASAAASATGSGGDGNAMDKPSEQVAAEEASRVRTSETESLVSDTAAKAL